MGVFPDTPVEWVVFLVLDAVATIGVITWFVKSFQKKDK
jgi:hypothetical protein